MVSTAVQDALTEVETGGSAGAIEYATWLALLENPQNLKGLCRIELQRHQGRAGMRTFAQLSCSMEDGQSVDAPGDVPNIDAAQVAHTLWESAIRDGKRNGCDTYRVQLFRVKGNGKTRTIVAGEYAGLRFNVVSGQAIWGVEQGTSPTEAWKEIAEFLRDTLKDVVSSQGTVLAGATGTLVAAVQAGDAFHERRLEHARRVEQLEPTPAETNERWRMGLNTLTHTARELVRFSIWNKTGNMPPEAAAYDVGATDKHDADDGALQAELGQFLDGLTAAQHDKLRAKMGADNYQGLREVVAGDLGNFQRNFPMLGSLLGAAINRGDLAGILSPDELATLCRIFGTDVPN